MGPVLGDVFFHNLGLFNRIQMCFPDLGCACCLDTVYPAFGVGCTYSNYECLKTVEDNTITVWSIHNAIAAQKYEFANLFLTMSKNITVSQCLHFAAILIHPRL